MRLICPGCGLTASAESWTNDAEARQTLLAITKLPADLLGHLLPYLGLFRPAKRALPWKKATRLLGELAQLTGSGHVQVQGKPSRPCPPKIWAEAMAQMLDRRDRLAQPMPNHNYLRQVAWQLAETADAQVERQTRQAEQSGHRPTESDDGLLPIERAMQQRGLQVPSLKGIG